MHIIPRWVDRSHGAGPRPGAASPDSWCRRTPVGTPARARTTTRREHDPTRGADALRGAMVREREPNDAPLVDHEVVDVAGGAYLDAPPQHGPEEITCERRPGDPVRLVLVQPRRQGRPVRPLPPRLQRRLTVAQGPECPT